MLGVGKVFCKKGWDFLLLALLSYFYRPPPKKSSFWWNMVFQFIQNRLWEMVNSRKIKDCCGPLKLYSKKLKAFLSWPAITEQDGVGRSFWTLRIWWCFSRWLWHPQMCRVHNCPSTVGILRIMCFFAFRIMCS